MTNRNSIDLHRPFIAAILSFFLSGLGQIYLHKISRGLILILSFSFSLAIIWIAASNRAFEIINWNGKLLSFAPAQRAIFIFGRTFHVTDIMKVTGFIQLAFTWIFGIIDAWREGKNGSMSL